MASRGSRQTVGASTARWAGLLTLTLLLPATAGADDLVNAFDAVSDGTQYLAVGVTAIELSSPSPQDRAFGSELGRSLAYTVAATEILKYLTQQPRPCDASDRDGFPSGHTSFAFAFAETVALHDPDWAIPAFALAAITGCSRVQQDAHYPWQVIAGAALGYLVAREVHRGNRWEW